MKKFFLLLNAAAVALALNSCGQIKVGRIADAAAEQCLILGQSLDENTMPRYFDADGLHKESLRWWCSGFFPGTCWYVYELSGREDVRELALRETAKMMHPSGYLKDHDAGFQAMCSAGRAYMVTGDEIYLEPIREAAEFLAGRFSPATGTIMSWDNTKWDYPVIIDNMMNLELLTFAAKKFDRQDWADIAISHARTTLANHFREDYSSYHLVDYNAATGEVNAKVTVQGYSDSSSWSRGQSWGLYGFTMMYRETGLPEFLGQAENIARYLLPLLENDPVPAWDFSAPEEIRGCKDASAGAVMASAFIELSTLTEDEELSNKCLSQAVATLKALSSEEYFAANGEAGGFILKHSTGHFLKDSEVDVSLTYADYYYMEALYRLSELRSRR